jgi:uncharacterized protein (TIGR03118 family)
VPGSGSSTSFSTNGEFIERVASKRQLNAPWGLAMAPESFGGVRRRSAGRQLRRRTDQRVRADAEREVRVPRAARVGGGVSVDRRLWSLQFGNDAAAGSSQTLFFTAGPEEESHGLFGSIDPAA